MKKLLVVKIVAVCLIFIVLVFINGCSNGKTTGTAGTGTDAAPFVIKHWHSTSQTTPQYFWIAHELGFDAEENLNFVDVGALPATEVLAATVAGTIDVGGLHINRTVAGIAAGAKVKCVVANTETTQEYPHMVFITKETSPINTAQDFKGIKLGLTNYGGCHEGIPNAWLLKNGISDPKNFYEVVVFPSEAKAVQALEQGDVDAVGFHKDPEWVKDRGGLKIIFTDYDVWESLGGATPFYFTEKFIEEHPDEVRRFVKVMAKTNNWINENLDQAREITARIANVDVKSIGKVYYTPDGVIDPETIQVWIDLLIEAGEIKPGSVNREQMYTNEFNELAKKS